MHDLIVSSRSALPCHSRFDYTEIILPNPFHDVTAVHIITFQSGIQRGNIGLLLDGARQDAGEYDADELEEGDPAADAAHQGDVISNQLLERVQAARGVDDFGDLSESKLIVERRATKKRGVTIPLLDISDSGSGIAKRQKIRLRIWIQGWNFNTSTERCKFVRAVC